MALRMRVAKNKHKKSQRAPVSLPERMPALGKGSWVDMKHPRCSMHRDDQITEFSLTFQQCMCLRCATAKHENFTDFVPITQYVDEKREDANALFDQIAGLSKVARGFRRDRHTFVENIKQAEKHIKATLSKVKHKLTRHIDMLENKMLSSLTRIVVSEKTSAKKVLTDIHLLEDQLTSVRERVNNVLRQGTDMEVVTAVVEGENNFKTLYDNAVVPDEKISHKSLQFKLSPVVAEFFTHITDLGEVYMQTEPEPCPVASPDLKFIETDLPSIRDSHTESKLTDYSGTIAMSGTAMSHITSKELFHRENGAVTMRRLVDSEMGYHLKPTDRFGGEASVVFTAEHEGPCSLTGVAALASGWVVVCDSKHKCIQLVNRRSEVLDDLMFEYKPCSLARISNNGFAISYAHKDFISLFNIDNRHFSHVRDIRIGGKGGNYNLAFCRNKFAVCRKGEIRIIATEDGSLLDTIPITTTSPKIVMSDTGKNIYMADTSASKVVCMTNIGKVVWEFAKSHMTPTSLALDLNQLFIAGATGRIFIVSIYGDLIKEIMCGGMIRAVSVDQKSGNLVLTQESKDRTRSRTVKIVSV